MEDNVTYLTAAQLQHDSFLLAQNIIDSGFRPTFMTAIWRGGTPVGCYVQEFLALKGIETDHIPIRTKRYNNEKIDEASEEVIVDQLEYIIDKANAEDSLLIVDDVYDEGKSIAAVSETLKRRSRKNTPHDIRIATLYYKPTRNTTNREPDFYIHTTSNWLIFPHELRGRPLEEMMANKGEAIAKLLRL